MLPVGIVGCGVAALSMIRSLKGKKIPYHVFESSSSFGGVWLDNYPGMGLQVKKEEYQFPDFPFSGEDVHRIPTREEVQGYISRFVTKHELVDEKNVSFNSKVTLAKQDPQDGSWTLTIQNTPCPQKFSSLVVCSGVFSQPYLPPSLPGQESFQGKVLHSSQVRGVFPDQNLVVMGGGKSAFDVSMNAKDLLKVKSSTMLTRKMHWITPYTLVNLIPLERVFLSRFGMGLVELHMGMWPNAGTIKKQSWVAPIIKVVETIFALQFGLQSKPKQDLVSDLYQAPVLMESSVYKRGLKEGKFAVEFGEIARIHPHSVETVAGKKLPCDLLVCATGFQKNYDWFDAVTRQKLGVEDDGLYLYRKIVPPHIKNLYFCGSEMACFSNILGSAMQAEWIARVLNKDVELPSREEMEAEVTKFKLWQRSWMPNHSGRASQVLLHQTHYLDDLLRDMKENPKRKSNPVFEFLDAYSPADYNGIIRE